MLGIIPSAPKIDDSCEVPIEIPSDLAMSISRFKSPEQPKAHWAAKWAPKKTHNTIAYEFKYFDKYVREYKLTYRSIS